MYGRVQSAEAGGRRQKATRPLTVLPPTHPPTQHLHCPPARLPARPPAPCFEGGMLSRMRSSPSAASSASESSPTRHWAGGCAAGCLGLMAAAAVAAAA